MRFLTMPTSTHDTQRVCSALVKKPRNLTCDVVFHTYSQQRQLVLVSHFVSKQKKNGQSLVHKEETLPINFPPQILFSFPTLFVHTDGDLQHVYKYSLKNPPQLLILSCLFDLCGFNPQTKDSSSCPEGCICTGGGVLPSNKLECRRCRPGYRQSTTGIYYAHRYNLVYTS